MWLEAVKDWTYIKNDQTSDIQILHISEIKQLPWGEFKSEHKDLWDIYHISTNNWALYRLSIPKAHSMLSLPYRQWFPTVTTNSRCGSINPLFTEKKTTFKSLAWRRFILSVGFLSGSPNCFTTHDTAQLCSEFAVSIEIDVPLFSTSAS